MNKYKELKTEILKALPFRIGDMLYATYFTKDLGFKATKRPYKVKTISFHISEDCCWITCELGKKRKEYYECSLWHKRENALRDVEMLREEDSTGEEFFALREKDLKEADNGGKN